MVMVALKQIIPAIVSVGGNADKVERAIEYLSQCLAELDEIEVKGRDKVDTLLGCMMAIEAIIGEDKPNG